LIEVNAGKPPVRQITFMNEDRARRLHQQIETYRSCLRRGVPDELALAYIRGIIAAEAEL